MAEKLGFFYSCHKEKRAVDKSIQELRKHYPTAPIYLVSDGGLDYSYLTQKYNNIFVSLEEDTMSDTFKVTDQNFKELIHQNTIQSCTLAIIDRLKRAIDYCNTEYMLMMDPDAFVRGPLHIPEGVKLLGSKINTGLPQGMKDVLAHIDGAKVINCWGATPAIFETKTFIKGVKKLTNTHLNNLSNEFYAIYAHDVLLPTIFALVGEEEVLNPDITECNRDYDWRTNNKPLVHQFKENYMKSGLTLVTSLYNLSGVTREDDRNWEDYIKWFKQTLSINCNFIIFTEPEVIPHIKKVRKDTDTLIIESSLNTIPYYYLLDKIQSILDSDFYKSNMKDINRVECKDAIYSVIQYSKFKWLREAAEINPFDTDYFFWIDAGVSRFLEPQDYKSSFPSLDTIEQLNTIDDTLVIQYNSDYYEDLTKARILPKTYFWDNRSFVCGSMFGGNETAITTVENEIDTIMNLMIKNKFVNNEQIALGYLTKIREDLFSLFHRTNPNKHLELFTELS